MNGTAESRGAPWHDERFNTRLPRPDVGASIKRNASDFVVRERLCYAPAGLGEHVYLDLTKAHANTSWVASQIAKYAEVRLQDVGYAGRKDRHAVTRQWFSVYLPRRNPEWSELKIKNVDLHQITRHRRKLRRGEIDANEFQLLIHLDSLVERDEIEARLAQVRSEGFPNYFGSQRFGRGLHNLERADRLLRAGLRQGGDRGMLISAARSWLFNCYLSGRLASGKVSGAGPLYGKSRDPQAGESSLKPIYAAWVKGLRKLGVRVGERQLLVVPEALTWRFRREALELQFELASGSYATSMLNEIFIVRDEARR